MPPARCKRCATFSAVSCVSRMTWIICLPETSLPLASIPQSRSLLPILSPHSSTSPCETKAIPALSRISFLYFPCSPPQSTVIQHQQLKSPQGLAVSSKSFWAWREIQALHDELVVATIEG